MPNDELPAAMRRDRISRLVRERGFVRVAELSRIFRTSPVTVRSDLDHLEKRDLVRRVHGGAVSTTDGSVATGTPGVDPKAEAKSAMGAVAASLIHSHQTVILGSGTTVQAVGRALVHREELTGVTVITNGLQLALALQPAVPRFSVVLTGGTLRSDIPALAEPLSSAVLGAVTADIAIVGCRGVSLRGGLTDDHLPGMALNRQLLEAARRRVLVADATKIGKVSVARFFEATDLDTLITEASADRDVLEELRDAGVKIETVG